MNENIEHTTPIFDVAKLKSNQFRVRLLRIAVGIFFIVVGLRIIHIQIVESEKYRKIAQKQYQSKVVLPSPRGILYDRNGNILASNATYVSFAADPMLAAEDAQAIAKKFSQAFGKHKNHYLNELKSESRFVWLERFVDAKYLNEIDLKKLNGVVVRREPKRLYFNDQIAGQLIGSTNIDNAGLAGIEKQFDVEFKGTDGYVVFQRDGLGRARPSVDYPRVEPKKGNNIYLTIDLKLQVIAEKALKKGIEDNKAEGGIIIVLQPRTGEILAIAQHPNINPNHFGKYEPDHQRLRAVTDLFEPGSVFKIVTASAALEHRLVKPDKMFYAENGLYSVPVTSKKSRKIVDTHKAEWITFQEAVETSSNIVMAKVSDIIGCERFYKMARDYGFGIATNIDFPGELNGMLKKPIDWWSTSLNTLSYGYEVGATPLQIACAYAAVANNGILMRPYILKKETDASNQIVRESQKQQIRSVISSETAEVLTGLFEGAVERGTGTLAKIQGIRIAGKTGTSKKYVEGQYEKGNYVASFIGFFPAEDPKIVCLVMIDKPQAGAYYGGTVSAPIFKAIAEQIINTTDVLSRTKNVLAKKIDHVPSVKSKSDTFNSSAGIVPDVRGQSLRRAIEILKMGMFEPVVEGSGIVITQVPEAGTYATKGMKISLICQPKQSTVLSLNR
ncbi:MAG: penicillin-binding protein [Bacteroidota bacterium]|nr:penicillin-binding protein [Bacteroidota bacterium]